VIEETHVTRLAPSPTGALHLGNARTFLVNWALARQRSWRVLLRIEDIDHPRVKPGTIDDTRSDLHWLGLNWDQEMPLQSTQLGACRKALHHLGAQGLIYPCQRTRRELAASAPNEGDRVIRADAASRPVMAGAPHPNPDPRTTWRLLVQEGLVDVMDQFRGTAQIDVAGDCGDFSVWTRQGVPAYQLAVAVDDARQGVTQVVRGDDLLPSAARQQLLLHHLDLPVPCWWHLPLLRGPDGRRLAKRHGDTRLSRWRHHPPDRVIGLLAAWCGVVDDPVPMSAAQFADDFTMDKLPHDDVIVQESHLQWLD
jgi:glutamyl-tRNA synthetase